MQRKTMTMIGAGIAAAGLSFGIFTIANAATSDESATGSTVERTADDSSNGGGQRSDETPLTGSDAERATAAAQAAVPDGTVIRVESDGDGNAAYEAHVRKTDGTEVVVYLDGDFAVTSVEEFAGRGGKGGPGRGETPLTGADAEQATAAAQAAVPDGTVLRVETDSDGSYEAHVRKADGTEVEVKMDSTFGVTSIEEHSDRGHGRGGRDDSGTDDGTGTTTQSGFGA